MKKSKLNVNVLDYVGVNYFKENQLIRCNILKRNEQIVLNKVLV